MDQQSTVDSLSEKAKSCLGQKSKIPMSPLWNMGKAAKFESDQDFKYMQDALDYLTCKARAKLNFEESEKEFLKELYEAFWWGGRFHGYKEAAALANHYVNGNGKLLHINSEIYVKSKIVQATMEAMKKFISDLRQKKHNFTFIKCNNPAFMNTPYAQKLKRMNYLTEGKMKPNGVLEAAQQDHRLHKADGHFYLEAMSIRVGSTKIQTTWTVNSEYDFEPFEKKDYFSEIPLGNKKLILYDGLSEYMTRIGVAKTFFYRAEWREVW